MRLDEITQRFEYRPRKNKDEEGPANKTEKE